MGRTAVFAGVVYCVAALFVPQAAAKVTIRGQVKYWDYIEGKPKPAKHVFVEIEGDWWLGLDPEKETDDNGFYRVTVRDPYWGDFDIDIETYAETQGKLQVLSWNVMHIGAWYPYYIISKEYPADAGDTLTLYVYFGCPHGGNLNVDEAGYRDQFDTAKAFMIHQELRDQIKTVTDWGWAKVPAGGTQKVVVPSAGETSFYFWPSKQINLVIDSAGGTGTGPWNIDPKHTDYIYNGKHNLLQTARHEHGHSMHHRIARDTPWGLWQPSHHAIVSSVDPSLAITNSTLAYTEGFAEFIPLATWGIWDSPLEYSRKYTQPSNLPVIPGLTFPPGNAWQMEGECAGIFLDLFDPTGYEVCRVPALTDQTGAAVPLLLQRLQVFWDGIEDLKGKRIYQVLGGPSPVAPFGSPESMSEFLNMYYKQCKGPDEVHFLRAICANRSFFLLLTEFPALLAGQTSLTRTGSTVTLKSTLWELDAEDRPWVRLNAYVQAPGGGAHQACKGLSHYRPTGPWQGPMKPLSVQFQLPYGVKDGDPIWIEVNDDMLPRMYRFHVPAEQQILQLDLKKPPDSAGPIPGAGGQMQKVVREDFETVPLTHWAFTGGNAVVPDGNNHLLSLSLGGTGVWDIGSMDDFTLTLRYRHGYGSGSVLFGLKDRKHMEHAYHLSLVKNRLDLIRQQSGKLQTLQSVPLSFKTGQWYTLAVARKGGLIQVSVDGKVVVSATDPKPLGGGELAFGSSLGTGTGFDDLEVHFSGAQSNAPPAEKRFLLLPDSSQRQTDQSRRRAASRQTAGELSTLAMDAIALLRKHGDQHKFSRASERLLYLFAQKRDRLAVQTSVGQLLPRHPTGRGTAAAAGAASSPDAQRFRTYLADRARGVRPNIRIPADFRAVVAQRVKLLDQVLGENAKLTQRLSTLGGQLTRKLSALAQTADSAFMQAARRNLEPIQRALASAQADQGLRAALQQQRAVMATLAADSWPPIPPGVAALKLQVFEKDRRGALRPVPLAHLAVAGGNGQQYSTSTDTEGRCRLNVLPGSCQVTAAAKDYVASSIDVTYLPPKHAFRIDVLSGGSKRSLRYGQEVEYALLIRRAP